MKGQHYVLDSVLQIHPNLVVEEANVLKNADSSKYFQKFFNALDSVYEGKKERVHIFHIGGSHIQADIYSNRLRTYLQNSSEHTMTQRGFVFPYKLANTNNPANYKVTSGQEWEGQRSSLKRDSTVWGLSGITALFSGSYDTIRVEANNKSYNKKPYRFNKLRLYCNESNDCYVVRPVDSTLVRGSIIDTTSHFIEYVFNQDLETINFQVERTDSLANVPFMLMGMDLMNDEPGIEYTSIGVNGANFPAYARSIYFEEQLKLYCPDLFIISIGTNDTYMPASKFDPEKFKADYEAFIQLVKRVNPECAILLTVPNDSYYRRRKPNTNTARAKSIIYELANKYEMAVWDVYELMGGLGSSQKWYQNQLMARDRVHFTQKGYHVKSDLLLKAFVSQWERTTGREPGSLFKKILENADE